MIPLADAQAELIAACPRLPAVDMPLADALDCVCADDVVARQLVPPFANSSVDGYAVRSTDLLGASADSPVALTVLGTVAAGSVASGPVSEGHAWKVMTGAPLPEGADTVVMVENTSASRDDPQAEPGQTVLVYDAPPVGAGTREAGSDMRPGDVVATSGTVVHAPYLGVLRGLGLTHVPVVARPRVGVLATGDELVTDSAPLRPGQIYETNRAMLLALLRHSGMEPVDLGVSGDDPNALIPLLSDAVGRCDAIVTTGGVSMGDADPVKIALETLGRLHWMQVSIRPAKPFAYALLDGPQRAVPLFGLPGNPVSSLVSFELLARPALRAMAGHADLHRVQIRAIADEPFAALGRDGRTTHLRVRAAVGDDGRVHVRPVSGGQDSHQLAATALADALAELPPGTSVQPGDDVLVRMLRWDP